MLVCCREEVWKFEYVVVCWIELHFLHVWSKPSLSSTFMVWLFVVLGLSFVGEMYRGIGERRSLSEENLRVSVRPRRNNVTLDAHAVNVEKMAALRKQRGGYASRLTRKREELKSLLDKGASVDCVQKRIVQVRAALKDLFDCNVKYIQLLESAGMPEEVPRAQMYYVEAENSCSEVLKLAEHRVSVSCALNLSSDKFEEEVNPEDSVSQTSGSTKKSSSTTASSARLKAAARKAALMARAQVLNDSLELKRKQLQLQHDQEQLHLRAKISEVEAEEKVYRMFEENDGWSDGISHVRSSAKKSPLNPNAVEWPACTLSDVKKKVSSAQDRGAGDEVKKEMDGVRDGGGDVGVKARDPSVQVREQQVSPNSTLCGEPSLLQMMSIMQLPKAELMTFDGDPLDFWMFMRSFDNSIGNAALDDSAKLNRLFQYCKGEALKVIKCCAVMNPSAGYAKARALLKERFGDDYKISEMWVKKVTAGPFIRPAEGRRLQELADDLRSCKETLEAMNKLEEIDTRRSMVKIVERLPQFLQGRWRKLVVKALETTDRYPSIANLMRFVSEAAREATDPVFGVSESKSKDVIGRGPHKQERGKGASLGVQADDSQQSPVRQSNGNDLKVKDAKPKLCVCRLCKGDHSLSVCSRFKAMLPGEKLSFVWGRKLCFCCFDGRHLASQCRAGIVCGVEGCTAKHSKLLHKSLERSVRENSGEQQAKPNPGTGDKPIESHTLACSSPKRGQIKLALPVVPVKVRAKGQSVYHYTYALLDSGSTKTFCSEALIEKLDAKGKRANLSLTTVNSSESADVELVSLEVVAAKGGAGKTSVVQLPKVYALPNLPSLESCIASAGDIRKWPHLKDLRLPQVDKSGVSILIGQDVPEALWPLELRKGEEGQPYATRTRLGWTLNGPLESECLVEESPFSNLAHADERLDAQVEQFWKLETSEALANSLPQFSVNDKRAVDIWERSVDVVDGHYQMDIPFKSEHCNLPDNRIVAEKRLQSLTNRFLRDPELHAKYKGGIQELLDKGYAEKVPKQEMSATPGRTWYLPHHNVVNENKPEKLRIVFDCAVTFGGTSLNKEVLQGPDFTNNLVGVLLRFREEPVAVMGDIEGMFHQVRVSPKDRDVLRFLWWKNGEIGGEVEVYRMCVHLFGGVWSPSCASFALRRVADDHRLDFPEETIQTVHKNFYADDCLKSVGTTEEAINIVHKLCQLLTLVGFRLTKWISNDRKVLEAIPEGERARGVKNLDLDHSSLPVERALGIHWNTESDQFGVQIKSKQREFTRRGLLSVVSSVYDPLGLVCPFVLRAKKIFQDECKSGKEWDDPLSPENQVRWSKWLEELPLLGQFKVERCLVPAHFGRPVKCELHHFCDASLSAYGSVSYLRAVNAEGKIHCALLLGKSRLAPIRQMTIPRLELSAAVIAVRMDRMLSRELTLEIRDSVFWSDSMIVLQYIYSCSKRFQTFVANRLSVIHDGSKPRQWRKVGTKENPADDVSRGLSGSDMISSDRWRRGPEFLWQEESAWPTNPVVPEIPHNDEEVKIQAKCCVADVQCDAKVVEEDDAPTADKEEEPKDLMVRFIESYSCWYRLKKGMAWLLRCKNWLRVKTKSVERPPPVTADPLDPSELQVAETAIVRFVQLKYFKEEVKALKSRKPIVKKSPIYILEPFLDEEEIFRVGGRLKNAPLSEKAQHPAILPKNHHVSRLVARRAHEFQSGHSGKEYVLSLIRQKFWIVGARPLIKRVLMDCVVCRKLRGKPGVQQMADLPSERVTPPFSFVGVDCFGPFVVKRGRSQVKRYGCIFTCLTMRAIHIEKLDSLEADSFINGFMRFCARRGVPEKVRSDNGTNFVAGERKLREAMQSWKDDGKVKAHLLQKEIKWEFNPPAASHMGGIWERQIRTVRKVLNVILREQTLDDERLSTLFCEVESIVNGRPLTVLSDDPDDEGPLTPNHLLLLRGGPKLPPGQFDQSDIYGRRWRHVQFLSDQFWKRWVREYLPILQLRRNWLQPKRNFQVGDVVLILGEKTPRKNWPMGRIVQTYPGKDGLVRSAQIKTSSSILTRPVTKLCLLECTGDEM